MSDLGFSAVESVERISSPEFADAYLKPLKPLLIKSLAKDWPAIQKWTPEFFTQQYGDKQVKVYDASFTRPGKHYMDGIKKMAFGDYIDQVLTTNQDLRMFLYNIKSEIPEIVDDIQMPELVDGFSRNFIFMFFGCRGSVTQMHFDIDMSHVFHTALYGKKTVTLFPYEQSANLHRYPFTCRSYVDIHKPDYQRYPRLKNAEGYQVIMEKGDTLFIPSGYWHHIVYDQPGYAISLRCNSISLKRKLHGLYNLLVMQMIDRLMNKVASEDWYAWKELKALQL